jgi:peptidoglycan DL-endopeptidase CwlO
MCEHEQEAALRRNHRTTIAVASALSAAAVAVGAVVAIAPAGAAPAAVDRPATPVVDRAAVVHAASAELADLERTADAVGAAAQRADEAVLQHDTAANRAAADAAQARLQALAEQQTPELTRLETALTAAGVDTTADGAAAGGATATTAALVGKTRALRAVSYAKQQIGDPYRFAGAGPGSWDCSGLTMKSYSAVKVGIGGHSATAQWRTARNEHRLHAYKNRKVGDLIFYGAPGAVYHVAIYAGHNRMIEAPYPGKKVREVPVRSGGRLAQVARPA